MTLVKGGPAARPEARSTVRPTASFAPRAAVILFSALALAGCGGGFGKYFGTDTPPPPPEPADPSKKVATEQATPEAQAPPGKDKPYPNLGSVPQTRPVRQSIDEQRQAIQQGLVADRQNARYTDQVIRHEPVSTAPAQRPVAAAATNVPKLPTGPGGAPAERASAQPAPARAAAPSPAPAARTASGTSPAPAARTQVAEAQAAKSGSAPLPPALPQPSLPGASPAAAASSAPIPVAPSPAGQQPAAPRSFAPPPAAAAQPSAAAGRSNFTLGTAVVQALEDPPEAAPPPVPAAQAAERRPGTIPSLPTAPAIPAPGSQIAQAPSVPPSGAAPAAGGSGASIYQPPQAPRAAPASLASVAQPSFQPPLPPLIPGQAPPPQAKPVDTRPPALLPPGTKGPTTAWSAQGAGQGAQRSPQLAAVPPPPSSYAPQGSAYPPPQSGYPPQAAYPAPQMQRAQPASPYPAPTATGAQQPMPGRSPLRPPPPPISPAMPGLTGADPIAEARMRSAAVSYDPVAEARRRTTQNAGQQVGLILFQNGSTSLQPGDKDLLLRVAALARQNRSVVRVVGHASGRTGEMDMSRHQNKNLDISMSRANAAAAELRAAGVPADSIVVEAKGDSEPVYRETMPSGEAGNRRVDVYLQ
jgi:flagellar motor protein MotB